MSFHNSLNIFLHLVLLTLFLLPSAYPLYFNISSFDPEDSQIIYGGDAQPSQGSDNNYFIEFNTVKFSNQVGRSTYSKPMHLWDSSTGELSDFTTNFSFLIDTLNASIYGHGFAFFLAPLDFPIPINSAGGFLGLFNQTTSDAIDKNQIIFVEFDTYSNPQWDPPMEHVGINKNSITSSVYTGWNASMHSGESINTCITYNSANNNLTVVWHFGETPSFQNNYSLSYQVDMKQVLPDWVTIGFTAATGTYRERHILHSWEFSSSLETNADNKNQLGKIKLIAIVVVPAVFLIVLVVIIYAVFRRKRLAKEKADQTSINFEIGVPRRFSYKELASATSNFSIERKLGEGGFGGVYRGTLANSSLDVAIKKISKESKQGKKEYMAEVKIISQLRHRNLVQLLGWCHERGEFLLVYDFMPQGSLDFHLFGNTSPLSWSVRYNIALGLASALLYLHEEREQCVVHRDIKSSNVMLDSDFNAKLDLPKKLPVPRFPEPVP
ncbi:hypothetical protein IFM89_001781 [Coptis chinensis]|uniref:Protein kinase domain-containing protein n=1 Tax=Coptis chinensis TaxID=261450 RepID=A0A835HID2_9MAGN|nr:hypothetical protein IFM89_001781 [Coptis chinensis]